MGPHLSQDYHILQRKTEQVAMTGKQTLCPLCGAVTRRVRCRLNPPHAQLPASQPKHCMPCFCSCALSGVEHPAWKGHWEANAMGPASGLLTSALNQHTEAAPSHWSERIPCLRPYSKCQGSCNCQFLLPSQAQMGEVAHLASQTHVNTVLIPLGKLVPCPP